MKEVAELLPHPSCDIVTFIEPRIVSPDRKFALNMSMIRNRGLTEDQVIGSSVAYGYRRTLESRLRPSGTDDANCCLSLDL